MAKYTVIGGTGFIGSEFVSKLRELGHDVYVPIRHAKELFENDLGIVIYAAGYGKCKDKPLEVHQANTNLLSEVLSKSKFEKLLYLSSTRVYINQLETRESSNIKITSNDERRLFNLTKLVSEELCLANEKCLIIRPSNVYGLAINSPLFLPSIIRDAVNKKNITMFVPEHYSKDYIYVGDVVDIALEFLTNPLSYKILNVAYGTNRSALEIANLIQSYLDCSIDWRADYFNDTETFQPIDVSRMKEVSRIKTRDVLDDLKELINIYNTVL